LAIQRRARRRPTNTSNGGPGLPLDAQWDFLAAQHLVGGSKQAVVRQAVTLILIHDALSHIISLASQITLLKPTLKSIAQSLGKLEERQALAPYLATAATAGGTAAAYVQSRTAHRKSRTEPSRLYSLPK
jgi:hypothetical protein